MFQGDYMNRTTSAHNGAVTPLLSPSFSHQRMLDEQFRPNTNLFVFIAMEGARKRVLPSKLRTIKPFKYMPHGELIFGRNTAYVEIFEEFWFLFRSSLVAGYQFDLEIYGDNEIFAALARAGYVNIEYRSGYGYELLLNYFWHSKKARNTEA